MHRLDILPFVTCLFPFARLASHQCEQRIYLKRKRKKMKDIEEEKDKRRRLREGSVSRFKVK